MVCPHNAVPAFERRYKNIWGRDERKVDFIRMDSLSQNSPQDKYCPQCKQTKPANAFSKHKGRYDGLASCCKECQNERGRAYRAANPGKAYEATKRWNEKNPEYHREIQKTDKYRESAKRHRATPGYAIAQRARAQKHYRTRIQGNREKTNQKDRERYAENPERKIASSAKWQKQYPEKKSAINHNRRAKVRGNGGSHTDREWAQLCKHYNFICLCCKKVYPFDRLTRDHVIPIARGGTNDIGNIQPLCFSCNSSKGSKIIDYRHDNPDYPIQGVFSW
jgi:hypothetical protein